MKNALTLLPGQNPSLGCLLPSKVTDWRTNIYLSCSHLTQHATVKLR